MNKKNGLLRIISILALSLSPFALANANDIALMVGSWQCTSENSMTVPGMAKPMRVAESYSMTTSADGASTGEASTVYYMPLNENDMPIEVRSKSSARYRQNGAKMDIHVDSWDLVEGRIVPAERSKLLAAIAGSGAPASAKSQMGAKLDRMAEDWAESIEKNYKGLIGKAISLNSKVTVTGPNTIEKSYAQERTTSVHKCTRTAKVKP